MTTIITPATLEAGEDFARLEDILDCQDIPEITIRVPWWRRKGKPMAVRVSGLDLDQQDQVRTAAARAVQETDRARGVKQNWPTFVCLTLALGMTSPVLTYDQAKRLAKKNARACEQIANFIWVISSVSQDRIDASAVPASEMLGRNLFGRCSFGRIELAFHRFASRSCAHTCSDRPPSGADVRKGWIAHCSGDVQSYDLALRRDTEPPYRQSRSRA